MQRLWSPGHGTLVLMASSELQDIPRLEIPLHTLIELVPKPDGRMAEERIPFDPATGRIGEVRAWPDLCNARLGMGATSKGTIVKQAV